MVERRIDRLLADKGIDTEYSDIPAYRLRKEVRDKKNSFIFSSYFFSLSQIDYGGNSAAERIRGQKDRAFQHGKASEGLPPAECQRMREGFGA